MSGSDHRETAFNHVGLAVADLERSRRFYEDVLGFRSWFEMEVPDEGTTQLLQLTPPVGLRAAYLVLDGFVLELLEYRDLGLRPPTQRVMNDPGLTHLSIAVRDIEAILAKVAPGGGEIVEETNIKMAVMIRDPDGQLIELTGIDWNESRPPLPS